MPSPSQPTLTGFSTDTGTIGDGRTTDRMLTFFGTGQAGASLEVRNAVSGSTIAFLPLIPANGSWTVTSTISLPNGDYIFNAGSRDVNDGQSSSLSADFPLTIEGPQVTNIDLLSDTGANTTDDITADSTPDIRFTAGDGDTLSIDWGDGNGFVSAGTGTGSAQTFTAPGYTAPFSNDQQITITVRATNGGTTVDEQFTFTLDRAQTFPGYTLDPSSDSGTLGDRITNDDTPTINGVAEEGATIRLSFGNGGGTVFETILVGSSGTWTATLPTVPGEGLVGIVANAVDRAGNSFQNNSSLRFDTIIPDAPTINSTISQDSGVDGDRITNDNRIFLSGTVELPTNNTSTIVRIYNGATLIGTDTTTTNGTWSLTTNVLADGVYNLTAEAVDPAGNISVRSSALEVTIDTTAPSEPGIVITAGSGTQQGAGSATANSQQPSFDVSAEAGTLVELLNGNTVIASGTDIATLTPDNPLAPNTYVLTVRSTDLAGNVTTSDSYTVTVPAPFANAPTLSLSASSDSGRLSDDNITNNTTLLLEGTADAFAQVTISDQNGVVGTANADGTGAWSYTDTATANSTVQYTAIAQLNGGTSDVSTTLSVTVDTRAPLTRPSVDLADASDTGLSDTDNNTGENTLVLQSSGEVGSTITFYHNDTIEVASGIVQANGTVSATTVALADGEYTFTARETDLAGNTSNPTLSGLQVTVDTSAPEILTLDNVISTDSGRSSTDRVTSDNTLTFTGTSQNADGSQLDAYVGFFDGNGVAVPHDAYSTVADGWQTILLPLDDGTYTFVARGIDLAGNIGTNFETITFTIDTAAPDAPTIGLAVSSDSGVVGDSLTNDTTPTLEGTTEANAQIEVFDGANSLGTVIANGAGVWSLTTGALAQSDYNLTAVATDVAGNTSAASSAFAFTIDTTAPDAPSIALAASSDSGAQDDGLTNDTTPTLEGTTVANAAVEVFNGTTSLGTVTADGAGSWSFVTATLAQGDYSFTAISTDVAGNTSAASSALSVGIDTTGPTIGSVSLSSASNTGRFNYDSVTAETQPTFIYSVTDAVLVEIDWKDGRGFQTIENTGSATQDLPFADGIYQPTLRATDVNGNVTTRDTVFPITIDTVAPDAPAAVETFTDTGISGTDRVTNSLDFSIAGTSTTGQFSIERNGEFVFSSVVAQSGAWTYSPAALAQQFSQPISNFLPEGTNTFVAYVEDIAGNRAEAAPITITIDTVAPDAPVLSALGLALTNQTQTQLSGQAELNSRVEVFDGAMSLGFAQVDQAGAWTLLASNLEDGAHSFTAVATDIAGNTSDSSAAQGLTVDTDAPDAPSITLDAGSDTGTPGDGITSVTNPTVGGVAEANASVEVFNGAVSLGTTTADGAGAWSLEIALAEGASGLTAVATDAAGNISTASQVLSVTVDTTAPDTPVVDLQSGSDSGSSDTDNLTSDDAPSFDIRTSANTVVEVLRDGEVVSSGAADANGLYTFTSDVLEEGVYAFSARAQSVAGNSNTGSVLTVTIDTTAPTELPVIESLAQDTGRSATDFITNNNVIALSGSTSTSDGDVLRLFQQNGDAWTSTITNTAGRFTSTTNPLEDGSYTVLAQVIDAAGNAGPITDPLTLIVDTLDPDAPTLTLDAGSDSGAQGDGVTTIISPTLSGVAEGNALVEVFNGQISLGIVTADGTGAWSLATDLTDGTYTLSAVATDVAGNTGAPSAALSLTLDSTGPVIGAITLDAAADSGLFANDAITNVVQPTLNYSVTDAALLEIDWKDGRGFQMIENTGTVTQDAPYADGAYLPTLRATDDQGNITTRDMATTLTIDQTAPDDLNVTVSLNDTGALDDDRITNDLDVTFSGQATGPTVFISFNNITDYPVAIIDGGWTLSLTDLATALESQLADLVPDGQTTFSFAIEDLAGNRSTTTQVITFDTIAPDAPTLSVVPGGERSGIDAPNAGGNVTNQTTFELSGEAEAGATIEVFNGAVSLGFAQPVEGGWSMVLTGLQDATYDLRAVAIDEAGNVSTFSQTQSFTVDTQAPDAPSISVASGGISGTDGHTNRSDLVLEGNAEGNAELLIRDGEDVIGQATADAQGNWNFATGALDEGPHSFSAIAYDAAGNASAASTPLSVVVDITAPSAPSITLEAASDSGQLGDGITNIATPTLQGNAEPGVTVTILNGEQTLGTDVADGQGNWSFTVPTLELGEYSFTVQASDFAGNISQTSAPFTLTIITPRGEIPVILGIAQDSGIDADDQITNVAALTVNGTGKAGETVEVFAGTQSLGTTLVTEGGTWLLEAASVSDGDYLLTAISTPSDGDGSDASASFAVTVDTIAPDAPTLALSVQSDSGVADGITNVAAPTIVGTAEAGAVIEVFNGQASLGTTTADMSGAWSLTAPEFMDATYSLTATATDVAGNRSASSASLALTVDTVMGPLTATLETSSDSGTSDNDSITNDATPTLRGTAEAFATIEVTLGESVIGTTTADAAGMWNLTTSEIPDGAHTLTVTGRDLAGNINSAPDGVSLTVDTTAPNPPVVANFTPDSGTPGDAITAQRGLSLSGTAEPLSVVELFVNDASIGTTMADGQGGWSFDYSGTALADGSYAFTAQSLDAAGNISALSTALMVEVDATAPDAPTITALSEDSANAGDGITTDTTPTLSGTAEQGSTVTILRDGMAVGTVVAVAGAWSYTSPVLADNSFAFTAMATDAAGNISSTSQSFTVVVDSTARTGSLDTTSVVENAVAGTLVGTVQLAEPALVELTDDADGRFVLVGSELRVAEGAVLDYEDVTTYDVTLRLTDLAGNTADQTVSISLTDVVETFGGGTGNDRIIGDAGDNSILAGDGDDFIFGGAGDDTIDGGSGNDTIEGGTGNDVLADSSGDNMISGGDGDDIVYAMRGTNTLNGDDGADLLIGGINNDALNGGVGNDILIGDVSPQMGGNDTLRGGDGDDLLSGGKGADDFIFTTNGGNDTIGTVAIDFANRANSSISGPDFISGLDHILLQGFGYADATEAFSHVSDVDGVATFSDQGTTITFAGLEAIGLSADDFFLI